MKYIKEEKKENATLPVATVRKSEKTTKTVCHKTPFHKICFEYSWRQCGGGITCGKCPFIDLPHIFCRSMQIMFMEILSKLCAQACHKGQNIERTTNLLSAYDLSSCPVQSGGQ